VASFNKVGPNCWPSAPALSELSEILEGVPREATVEDLRDGVPAFNKVRDDLTRIKQLYEAQGQIVKSSA